MKLSKARRLNYYEVVLNDKEVVRQLDTLARRMFGKDAVGITGSPKNVKPRKWIVMFWATEEEFDVIKDLMNDLASQRLDDEYKELIEKGTF